MANNISKDCTAIFQRISSETKLDIEFIEFENASVMKLHRLLNKERLTKENQLIKIAFLDLDLDNFKKLELHKRYSGVFQGVVEGNDGSMYLYSFTLGNFDLDYKPSSIKNTGEDITIRNITMIIYSIDNISYSLIVD